MSIPLLPMHCESNLFFVANSTPTLMAPKCQESPEAALELGSKLEMEGTKRLLVASWFRNPPWPLFFHSPEGCQALGVRSQTWETGLLSDSGLVILRLSEPQFPWCSELSQGLTDRGCVGARVAWGQRGPPPAPP